MSIIILNFVTLVYSNREDVYLEHKDLLDSIEIAFTTFYIVELALKLIGKGIVLDSSSYLRDT